MGKDGKVARNRDLVKNVLRVGSHLDPRQLDEEISTAGQRQNVSSLAPFQFVEEARVEPNFGPEVYLQDVGHVLPKTTPDRLELLTILVGPTRMVLMGCGDDVCGAIGGGALAKSPGRG
jgi:hypothetical protein